MVASVARSTRHPAYRYGGIALIFTAGSILTALAFQYIGGYQPCPLCLLQRYAYYAGAPALFIAMALFAARSNRIAALLFLVISIGFLANAGLGVYHSGVEWKFWAGPDTCAPTGPGTLAQNSGNLLKDLEKTRVIRCDEAPWRMFGLSFAGWNVVTSFLIFAAALQAAFAAAASKE